MIVVFIVLLLSALNIHAVPPSNMVLIDSLDQIDNLNEPPPINCQKTAYDRPVQGFTGTVSCNIKCKGQEERIIEVDNTFTNRDMNLRPGDGGLHASFNVSLDLWLDSICLQVGSRQCGPSNLETTKLKSLTSKNWKYDGPVYCPTIEEAQRIGNQRENIKEVLPDFKPLRHPFEKTAGTALSTGIPSFSLESTPLPSPGFNVTKENKKIDIDFLIEEYAFSEEFMNEHSEFYERQDLNPEVIKSYILEVKGMSSEEEFIKWRIKEKNIKVRSCAHPITIHACYGDCIIQKKQGGFIAMMSTNEISDANIGEKVVCGDNLFSFIKENNIPTSLHKNYCRMFLNNTFSRNDESYTGTTCSAFRFKDPCEELVFN